ncbi:hypothetical protein MUN88_17095 [Gracilibacillus caseinilyticus]|uniref:Phage terminase-like protein, large subunit, contains N-terminal HTH domain n=1 Tax=Gracilibacillus caseinilyticus TaxID=2932256 RepID=A0ABY4EU02_9BACI|nr:hypothetical protein [Gracilibacillus caseinilyticus]UOQ47749.1 hypothetical protein MUN88_17095 [Gracilibacillus caseinilyticus]
MDDITEINTKENRQLLYKYLIKMYGKEKAKELMFKHKDNLFGNNSLAYSLGKRSIVFYCLYFLQDYFVPKDDNTVRDLAPVHYDIWRELEDIFIHHTHDKQQFILPRGCAKTSIIDMALSCWLHCYRESIYTVVLANRELDAINFVEQTKIALQTPYIKNTFGELVQPRKRTVNKLELELDNDTKIQAYSSGSSVRGTSYTSSKGKNRVTCFIADDYISEADILSDESKEKKYIKWQKEVEEAGDDPVYRNGKLIKSGTKFIVLGTPLAKGDFIDSIKNDPEYKVFHKSVVPFDPDEYFENHTYWQKFKEIFFDNKRENPLQDAKEYYEANKEYMAFETIWEKYSHFELAKKYFNKKLVFMQELMCDVDNVGDSWFKSNRTMPMKEIENHTFIKTMLTIDTAGVKNKDAKRSDYFAFVVGSLADNDFKYVRQAHLRKFKEFDEYIKHVISLLKENEDITHVYIEKNTYNGLDVDAIKSEMVKHSELMKRDITFINEMQRKNKDDKISTIVDAVNNGRIIFCEERVEQSFLDQVMSFAGQRFSLHDDAADCLSEFANRIDEIEIMKNITTIPRGWLF